MTSGVYVEGERPRSKSALKRAIQADVRSVVIEDTDSYGLAPEIEATEIEEGQEYEVCGPDPYSDRRWTATITRAHGKVIVR